MFYFSNNYLDFISRFDAQKPRFKGDGPCNVAEYRPYDIPSFGNKPFIFPQMGRYQDCKNAIFTGTPELITGNLRLALQHFQTTDFAEYAYIVHKYAENIHEIHPSSKKKNGMFYYQNSLKQYFVLLFSR